MELEWEGVLGKAWVAERWEILGNLMKELL